MNPVFGVAVCALALALCGGAQAQVKPALRIWLIPAENAGPDEMTRGEVIRDKVDEFNRVYSRDGVVVENTTDPILTMKLLSWNPAFAVPNASVVTSQKRTLLALQRFARLNEVTVNVRFITWDEAFSLVSAIDPERRSSAYPDVIQIGSTWEAYLASRGLIRSRPEWQSSRGNWKDILDLPASALPFITDVRLLFYWKRRPPAKDQAPPATDRELVLNTSTWQAVVDSIRDRGSSGDTIAFATGLTLNVIHDYAPLVWAGGGEFVQSGWFGQRVDLTSKRAMSQPKVLMRMALEMPKPGEPRRLVAFPESSHEEVTRIFVNGGYRVTLEPANFIGRWRQDFEQRHQNPPLRFWDYAATAVPPKPFRGGSALVVARGTPYPAQAFSLADFLANDSEFTSVLAESGHLPAGRPGYGAAILASALNSKGRAGPEVDRFVDSVQKAIVEGISYPPMETWPTALENRQVQEALQVVWRRIAEGNEEELDKAATEVERLINPKISWLASAGEALIAARWALMLVLLLSSVMAAVLIKRRAEAQNTITLLLYLYRAFRHDAAKFLGDNLRRLADRAESQAWSTEKLRDATEALGSHYSNKLVPHINSITNSQYSEMKGRPIRMRLDRVVNTAYDGAQYIFEAKELEPIPAIRYALGSELLGVELTRLPSALVVVLEEWFLNCFSHIAGTRVREPVVIIKYDGESLRITSSGAISSLDLSALDREPSADEISANRQGLPLIRNILFFAYGVKVDVRGEDSPQGEQRIVMTIPLKKTWLERVVS